ncbi:phospholipase A [Sphaerotilus montanus]|uniref:phospholipase A n=1 Tax=Sphaerotilus montanus TaxID=522889 RepID=UPI003FA2BA39
MLSPLPVRRTPALAAWTALLCAATPLPAAAADDASPTDLQRCAAIADATPRLACYDTLSGRLSAPPAAPAERTAPATTAATHEPRPTSELSRYWELDAEDKRGELRFVSYRPNYILPLHVTSRINRAPQSPTQAAVAMPDYRRTEAKFQLSLRTKLVQDAFDSGADLWAGFTQQALWQVFNGRDSAPFRNTDYEPELMLVMPTRPAWRDLPGGWQWRYTMFGAAHQSNGQSDPLSRSWNRVYLAAGIEQGPWSLTAKVSQRLDEPFDTDNNPDLTHFRGRTELRLRWVSGPSVAALQYNGSPRRLNRGALTAEWSRPIRLDQPDGLRWYVQAFSGHGETLTDYNFRQTSVGAGVMFSPF